jgi:hypothetical protein
LFVNKNVFKKKLLSKSCSEMGRLVARIIEHDESSIVDLLQGLNEEQLVLEAAELQAASFPQPMQQVRALMFLYYIYQFKLTGNDNVQPVCYEAHLLLSQVLSLALSVFVFALLLLLLLLLINLISFCFPRQGKVEEAIHAALLSNVMSVATCSLLATAYRQLAFSLLAKLVRTSVQQVPGNGWLFDKT